MSNNSLTSKQKCNANICKTACIGTETVVFGKNQLEYCKTIINQNAKTHTLDKRISILVYQIRAKTQFVILTDFPACYLPLTVHSFIGG